MIQLSHVHLKRACDVPSPSLRDVHSAPDHGRVRASLLIIKFKEVSSSRVPSPRVWKWHMILLHLYLLPQSAGATHLQGCCCCEFPVIKAPLICAQRITSPCLLNVFNIFFQNPQNCLFPDCSLERS